MTANISSEPLKILSLGGGPGTDVFGLVSTRNMIFNSPPSEFHFRIFDRSIGWKSTLDSLLEDIPHPEIKYEFDVLEFPVNDLPAQNIELPQSLVHSYCSLLFILVRSY